LPDSEFQIMDKPFLWTEQEEDKKSYLLFEELEM
jgi:hypothetical protein